MAPGHALVALLSLATTAIAQSSSGFAYWTYTSRYAAFASPSPYTRGNGEVTTYTVTDRLRTVKPSITPTATPTSTSTYYSTYADLQIVYQYYGLNAGVAESDLVPERDYSATTTSTISNVRFSMPVTMSAPASCPTPFTITTTASVTVPSQVWDRITPASKDSASTSSRSSYVYIYETWYLSAGAAPFTTTSDFYYSYYIASCSRPPGFRTTSTGTPRSGGGDSSSSGSGSRFCYSYYYCDTPLKVWIIIIASVIPGLFLLGFLESWFWFRRLMLGKSAMRFGTVCWVLISLWVLCFTRMQDARSKEDQKLLQEKWKAMGSGAAFKAWWKWGFRHSYPVEHLGQFSRTSVGIVPAGQPINPAMSQAPPPVFTPGAPPPAFTPGAPHPSPGAPGQPGQVYYYGPPPPGWVPTPDGQGFMPPQGYMYPPQQAGFYNAEAAKNDTTVSSSPISTVGQQQPGFGTQPQYGQAVSPIGQTPPPQPPQPVYPTPNIAQMPAPSPPPQGAAPSSTLPPTNVSEVSGDSAQRPAGAPQHPPT
ncbi:hypothetical protein FB567DRAFT_174765 [Paraphoma chrysanthemicola]|uniref:Uncharacterized protein n=1 Tax=Paraphoma chrysanthemicola TaxID=798071 RepID=A0A8K0RFL8_9PLEO|nr:hypothetical protein FB567DRAFT_174765 [Paraphoma chrysanthemicola]